MAHNFVLMFQGKEGSSAYVSHLGNHPQIAVPLFEGLDRHKLQETHDPELVEPHLPAVVARIFATGRYDPSDLERAGDAGEGARRAGDGIVGFKWRIWGDPQNLIDSFRAHDVMLLNIRRADFADLMFSVYTTYVAKQEDPVLAKGGGDALQFRMAAAGKAERARIEAGLRDLRFVVDPQKLWPLINRRLRAYRARLAQLRVFAGAGIPVHNISYERFVADPRASLCATLDALGLGFHEDVLNTRYRKVLQGNPRDLAENAAEILALPRFRRHQRQWDRIIAQMTALESEP